jgi:hypothetical protein
MAGALKLSPIHERRFAVSCDITNILVPKYLLNVGIEALLSVLINSENLHHQVLPPITCKIFVL